MKKELTAKYLGLLLRLVLACTAFHAGSAHASPITITKLDDFTSWPTSWTIVHNASITQYDATSAQITCGSGDSYGTVSQSFTYNVDTYPTITVNVTQLSSGATWSLKVNNGGADIPISVNTTSTGVFSFNLKSLTGWSGNQAFTIKLVALGGNGKYFVIDYVGYMSENILDDFTSVTNWSNYHNATITQYDPTTAQITCGSGDSYGTVSQSFTYNVDAYPTITVNVTQLSSGATWSLKVNNGGLDIPIEGQTTSTGVLSFDLKRLTGWSGNQTFAIKLVALGGNGKYFTIDYLSNNTIESSILDDFTAVNNWTNVHNSSMTQYDSETAQITCLSADSYGTQSRAFTYNVSNNPMLYIKVSAVGAGSSWSLKVNNGSGDIVINANSSSSGSFSYNLASITGWSGVQTFDVKIVVLGGNNAYCMVDYLSIAGTTPAPQNYAYWSIRGTNYYPRDFPWGKGVMWTPLCPNSVLDADCLTMKNLGINTVRITIELPDTSLPSINFNSDWSATAAMTNKLDTFLTSCNNNGIKAIILFVVGKPNIEDGTIAGNNYVQAKNFYYSLINPFKNDARILAWDEINEPDNPVSGSDWSSNMANFVGTMFSYMKTLTTQPITIGLCWRCRYDELQAIGVTPDIFQFHQYANTDTAAQIATKLNNLKAVYPSTPILVGEFGQDTYTDTEAQQQQSYQNELDGVNQAGGIYGTCNWCLLDFTGVYGSPATLGILRTDGSAKPSASTLMYYY